MEVSSSAFFFTLTYDNEHLPSGEELSKRDIQLFIKRLRKRNQGIRYFAIGEYGTEFGRPHYHAVIFNLIDLDLVTLSWADNHGRPIGHVTGSRATLGRIRYMVEYMALPQKENGKQKAFRLMSRNPGIGHNYIQKWKAFHKARSDSVVFNFSTPCAMPRYYKDKIYTTQHQKAMVVYKARKYSEEHPTQICYVEHENLQRKLNRKHR
ncbi:replication initiator protein [robinz microvirus RP_171]|nr:replication initiator protein [robinz microvirus RP_171]